jgi:hypothetical protein
MVDAQIKSRHWANYTLKQAGLPEGIPSAGMPGRGDYRY